MDGPAVGTYDIQSAIQKTQFRRLVNTPKSTAKNQCFVDIYKKKKEQIPAPGHYKNLDNFEKTLNKDKAFMKPSFLMK